MVSRLLVFLGALLAVQVIFADSEVLNGIRYYPRATFTERMLGGVFEGTNGDPLTGSYETLYTITSNPPQAWSKVEVSLGNSRYLRYRGPDGSYGNVAEIEFYRNGVKLAGTGFGTPGSSNNSGNTFSKALDGDVSTFFDGPVPNGVYVGIDTAPGANFLTVASGSGDGFYLPGTMVTVSADPPPPGEQFSGWLGDRSILSNPFLATTTAIMPSMNVTIYATYSAGALPAPWQNQDIGGPGIAGSATFSSTFTIRGGGEDIWNNSDQFHFVYQALPGDGTLTARVASVQNTDSWAKAGVMLRTSLNANSAFVMAIVTPGNGTSLQWRSSTGGSCDHATVGGLGAPRWVRLVRSGGTVTGFVAPDLSGAPGAWTQIGPPRTLPKGTIYAGLPVTAHNNGALSTAVLEQVTLEGSSPSAPPTVASAALANPNPVSETYTALSVLGADDGGEAALTYAWSTVGLQPGPVSFSANGTNAAKNTVATFINAGSYTLRATITDTAGQSVTSDVVITVIQTFTSIEVAPPSQTVTVGSTQAFNARAFDQFHAALESQPGFTWTASGGGTISGSGLFTATTIGGPFTITAASGGKTGTASVMVTSGALPAAWQNQDIGGPGIAGSSTFSSTFTIRGSGEDIWNNSDQFHFVYQALPGDGTLTARVTSLQNTDPWAKAGVMLRTSLNANSAFVMAIVTPGNGTSLQWRPSEGSGCDHATVAGLSAPRWVRLVRSGGTVTGFIAPDFDGLPGPWTQIGTPRTLPAGTIYAGLPVTAHNNSALTTAVIEQVTLTGSAPPTTVGTGLTGQYWTNQDKTFNGAPTLTRTDRWVDFFWTGASPYNSPDPSISGDHFTARWTGQVLAEYSEPHTFFTTTDDGVRLWINGQLIIDKWIDQGPTEWSGTISLVAGQKYDLKLEFYENGGGAVARLAWSSPSRPKQIIPKELLFLTSCGHVPPLVEDGTSSPSPEPVTCGAPGAAPLAVSLVPFHEDSSIQTHIDLNAIDVAQYATLGVVIATEDGVPYRPAGNAFAVGANLQQLTPHTCFHRAFANLNPGKTYEVCLSGITSQFTTTGPFACTSIKTAPLKPETALLVTNSQVSSVQSSIDAWLCAVKKQHPNVTVQQIQVPDNISVQSLWNVLRKHYRSSNLTTVIFGSPDLPLPLVENFGQMLAYSGVYTSLTRDFMANDGFDNPSNALFEISIVSWNARNPSALNEYLARVLRFYDGSVHYARRLLAANAMIPADLPEAKAAFLGGRYNEGNTDYVGDITDYSAAAQGNAWQTRYAELLSTHTYEQLILNAHGTTTDHFPCDSGGCIDASFIRAANPQAMFVVALSCDIGNLGVPAAPMNAYVFEGGSLGGLGSEITLFSNAEQLKIIKDALSASVPIGKAGRRWGLTTFGDPFLKLDPSSGTSGVGD